jgi:microcystin-dependent protein
MFDFPASPVEGQIFQPVGGTLYIYKAPVWLVAGVSPTPAGTIITIAMATPPLGFLKANGALLSRTTYSVLFAAIGTTYGAGDGSTTFAIPDLRGEFPRYWDDARGIDTGRGIGTAQADGLKTHTHTLSVAASGNNSVSHTHTVAVSGTSGGRSASHNHAASGTTGTVSANHTHTFSGAANSGTASANHGHSIGQFMGAWNGTNKDLTTGGVYGSWSSNNTTANGADHIHATTISGTTSGHSANHTHTFSDTVSNETTDHTHSFSDASSATGNPSANHTHTVDGTTAAPTGATAENRPRNVALLACIKY